MQVALLEMLQVVLVEETAQLLRHQLAYLNLLRAGAVEMAHQLAVGLVVGVLA